jgi:hypothetical protein
MAFVRVVLANAVVAADNVLAIVTASRPRQKVLVRLIVRSIQLPEQVA